MTGIDETKDPKMLAKDKATSSRVASIPLPPKAFEIATLPSTAIIGTNAIDDRSSLNYK